MASAVGGIGIRACELLLSGYQEVRNSNHGMIWTCRSEETLLVLLVVGTDVEAALSLGTSSSLLEQ